MVFNIPNILSLFRLILVFVFPFAFFKGNMLWGLLVFVVASATDWLDGMIARKTNSITDIGKVLDPLADKMMLIMALVCLFIRGKIPTVVLIVGRQGAGHGHRRHRALQQEDDHPGDDRGKLATVTFFLSAWCSPSWEITSRGWGRWPRLSSMWRCSSLWAPRCSTAWCYCAGSRRKRTRAVDLPRAMCHNKLILMIR